MDRTQFIQRSEETAAVLTEWRRQINDQAQTHRPLWRRVARVLVPVLGPVVVLLAPPLAVVVLGLAHR
jgi:hypothetical protein